MIPDQMKEKENEDKVLRTPHESPVHKEVNLNETILENYDKRINGNVAENNDKVESKDNEDLYPCLPKSLSYELGTTDFRRLYFFVDLWHVQKIVQPVGLHNIIPVLETFKHKTQLPTEVLHSHNKVSYLTILPAIITCLSSRCSMACSTRFYSLPC